MTEVIDVSRRAVLAGTVATLLSAAGLAHGSTPASNHLRRTTMNIMRSGSQPSAKGEYFTGAVRIDMPFKGFVGKGDFALRTRKERLAVRASSHEVISRF